MNIMDILSGGFLKGQRTYILGFLVAAQAVASFFVGDITLVEFFNQVPEILGGLGLMALRASTPSE